MAKPCAFKTGALSRFFYCLLLIVFLGGSFYSPVYAKVLAVPQVIQEQDQWCWAAVSAATLKYYGRDISQCTIAEYARGRVTWHDFGSVNCCIDASQGCNSWNYNYGVNGSIQDILQYWGVNNSGEAYPLSKSTATSEIENNRPFIIRWGWDSGGGHFIVGHGIAGDMVYYMNPWDGEGLKIGTYDWVVSGSNHTWTDTNLMTTPPPITLKGDINGDGAVNVGDVIIALQIMSRMDTTGRNVTIGGDINSDGRIGLEEIIYILQKVAEMR